MARANRQKANPSQDEIQGVALSAGKAKRGVLNVTITVNEIERERNNDGWNDER